MEKTAGQPVKKPAHKKKRRRSISRSQLVLSAVVCVALMGASFGLGWHVGVRSTRYRVEILLVND